MTSPGAKQAIADTVAAATEADRWVRGTLQTNHLGPDVAGDGSGKTVLYANKTAPLATVIADTVRLGRAATLKFQAQNLITADRVQRMAAELLLAASPGGGKMGGKDPLGVSMYLQYTFTPATEHTPLKGGGNSTDQPAHTVSGQITVEFHGKDASGFELSGSGQATFFADDKGGSIKPQSGSLVGQLAWVWTFMQGNFQVGPQLQVLLGAARANIGHSDKLEWTPTGQISAQGQAQYKIPGFTGHLLVGVQAGGSLTAPAGGAATADKTLGFTLTWQF